jgi:hypothetical protein
VPSYSAVLRLFSWDKIWDKTLHLNGRVSMARPAANLHLQPKSGGWRARVLVPVELQGKLGRKVFSTPVWQVEKAEAAALAWPEVQKFEALIEQARSGEFVRAVEVDARAPLRPLVPSFQLRGTRTAASETTFTKLIAEWARKKRIDNPQTKRQRETHFQALAEFLGHDNGADVTSPDIVRFEKHLETTPDPRTGKLRSPNTPLSYLSSFKGVFTVAVQSRSPATRHRGSDANTSMSRCGKSSTRSANCR